MNSDRTTIGYPAGLRIGSGSGSYERTYERTDVEVGSGCLLTLGRTRRGAAGFGHVRVVSGSLAASRSDYRRRLATDTPKPPLRQHTTQETP